MLHCIVSDCTWIARIGRERFLLEKKRKKNCPKSHSLGPKDYESPAYIFKSLLPPTKVGQSNSFKERQTWHFKDCGKSCGSFPISHNNETRKKWNLRICVKKSPSGKLHRSGYEHIGGLFHFQLEYRKGSKSKLARSFSKLT